MKKTILALLAMGFMGAQAYALNGTLTFSGDVSASGVSKVAVKTTITFVAPWKTTGGTGSYTPVPTGTTMTMSNFSFTGTGVGAVLTASVIPQWTFMVGGNTYSFDLTSLTFGTTTATGITLLGLGTAHINGTMADAVWSLIGSGSGFKFKAVLGTTSATGVPEGGSTVMLLGLALAGIGAVRRKFAR